MTYFLALALLTLSFFASERAEAFKAAAGSMSNFDQRHNAELVQASAWHTVRANFYDMLVGPLAVGAVAAFGFAIWNTFA